MRKKIFFSVNLPSKIKKEISFYLEDLRNELKGGVKWADVDNLHITLLFLGLVKEELIPNLIKKTENIKWQKFFLSLENISYFPKNKKDAKMIWINLKGEGIDDVARMIKNELGFSEKEKFIPHVTLGRIKKWEFNKLLDYGMPNINIDLNIGFNVSSFKLMESKLKKTKPKYFLIKSFNEN